MRILFITDNYPPESNAPAIRTYEHISEWSKSENIKIIVITCFPNFPFGKIYNGYKNKLISKENIDGITIYRVWSYVSRNTGFFKRILDFLSFSFMAGIFIDSDVIVATSPQFFTTWSAFFISKLRRKPWIFELRDLWPETINSVNLINNRNILKVLEKIEITLYKDCYKVIALTNSFKRNLISRGINKNKIEVITNGINTNFFKIKKSIELDLKLEMKLKNQFVVGYFGTHGMCQGLDFILNAIPSINNSDIHFLFIGDGSEKQKLRSLAFELKINNLTFLDSVDRKNLPYYYNLIDIALVCLKKNKTFKSVIPSKIFEACTMQKPILLGLEGESKELIEKYKAGLPFIPEDSNDFRKKLNLIMDNSSYTSFKKGCKSLASNYRRDYLAKKMLDVIKKVNKETE